MPRILEITDFKINLPKLAENLHVKPETPDFNRLEELAEKSQQIAKPRAIYKIAYINSRDTDTVKIDDVEFKSRVLCVNLSKTNRVFPVVATCGTELNDFANSLPDMLEQYWLDQVKESALRHAWKTVNNLIKEKYKIPSKSAMSPGSLEDWPIQQQKNLFKLLENPEKLIGVKLTDSCLMLPNKSLSSIIFPTQATFESCQLCPRKNCPGRRAPYEPNLMHEKYE